MSENQLLIAAGDSLYNISLLDGSIVESCAGVNFLHIKMIQFFDSVLVAGFEQVTGRILLECFFENQFLWSEVITTGLVGGYQELNLVPHENGALVSYIRSHDLFYRIYNSVEGLSEERIICNAPEQQGTHKVITTGSTTVVCWFDYRDNLYDVYLQHIVAGQTRWLNGYRVGSMSSVSPWPPISLCAGGEFGWLVWTEFGYCNYQPGDSILGIEDTRPIIPISISCVLKPAYPNPFNPSTVISYNLPLGGNVLLKVYNLLGQEVRTLVNQMQTAGHYSVRFDSQGLPTGVYLYRLSSGSYVQTKRMILLK